jgi:mono/diheme cytochrome c family protein
VIRTLALALVATGCDWQLERMNDQPRCEPGEATPYLPDRRCDQPPPAGTVPWRATRDAEQPAEPPRPTRATIARGMDRYARFCATCHGLAGDGRTVVAADMLLRPPPSLHEARLVEAMDQRIYDVIGDGYGMMPAYGWVLPPADRWSVVHFVRVLQRSQAVAFLELQPARRQEALRWLR